MTSRIVCSRCSTESFASGASLYCWSCAMLIEGALESSNAKVLHYKRIADEAALWIINAINLYPDLQEPEWVRDQDAAQQAVADRPATLPESEDKSQHAGG